MSIDQIAESCMCVFKVRRQQRADQADPDSFIFYCFSFILSLPPSIYCEAHAATL